MTPSTQFPSSGELQKQLADVMGIASHVYAEELSVYGHGRPLWIPEPVGGEEIRLGDVGYIDRDGQFHRIFNMTVGPEHPYNRYGVPEGFIPLPIPPHLVHIRRNHLPPGPISSASIRSCQLGASLSANLAGVSSGALSYKFDCSRTQGAALVLMDSAKKTYMANLPSISQHIGKYHASWQEFARGFEMLRPEELIVVQATIKTTSWAVGAYVGAGGKTHSGSFDAQVEHVAGAAFHWSFANQTSTQFEHRESVPSSVIEPEYERPSCIHGMDVPDIVAERNGNHTNIHSGYPTDQCVFLAYWKVKYRFGKLLTKLEAGAGPATLPKDSREPSPGVYMDSSGSILDLSIPDKYRTPVDDILDYILDTTNASLAIACDSDVKCMLRFLVSEETASSPSLAKVLANLKPEVVVDENGTGSLLTRTQNYNPGAGASASLVVENTKMRRTAKTHRKPGCRSCLIYNKKCRRGKAEDSCERCRLLQVDCLGWFQQPLNKVKKSSNRADDLTKTSHHITLHSCSLLSRLSPLQKTSGQYDRPAQLAGSSSNVASSSSYFLESPITPTNDQSFPSYYQPTIVHSAHNRLRSFPPLLPALSDNTETFPLKHFVTDAKYESSDNSVQQTRKRHDGSRDDFGPRYCCNYPECSKVFGTLNHLNAHVAMQKHGPKRTREEFKEVRKQWRQNKAQRAVHEHGERESYSMHHGRQEHRPGSRSRSPSVSLGSY